MSWVNNDNIALNFWIRVHDRNSEKCPYAIIRHSTIFLMSDK